MSRAAMTHRERVLAALDHRTVDRVPIDLSGHRSSGIAAIAYARLRRHLGLPQRPVRVYDPIQQLAVVDPDVLDRFDIDTIELGRAFAEDDASWVDWILPDGTPCQMPAWAAPQREDGQWVLRSATGTAIGRMPDGALYFEQSHFPLLGRSRVTPDEVRAALNECMWTAVASPPGPLVDGPGGSQRLAAGARRLRQESDRAIIGLFGGNLLETGQFLFRNDGFFMLLAGDPGAAHAFLDHVTALHMENLERFMQAAGPYIDIILFGDDLGMQNGPQISPDMYREFFKPRHAAMWRRAHELGDVKVMLHSCGGLRELLPDLVQARLDAVNPVQISCSNMDLGELRREFDGQLTLWGGGCDTRTVLPGGTPDDVAAHVRAQIAAGGKEGGFVFQQVHNILADVPPENIVSMFDAARGA